MGLNVLGARLPIPITDSVIVVHLSQQNKSSSSFPLDTVSIAIIAIIT